MSKAPHFVLQNQDNHTVTLDDFKGQRVLIFFFPKAFTPGCTDQACGFRDNFPQISEQNATVIGISPDDPETLKKWKEHEHLPYMLLSDPDHQVAEAYGVWTERSMFGNKYFGIARSHFIIDEDGNLVVEARKISPKDSVKKGTSFLTRVQKAPTK